MHICTILLHDHNAYRNRCTEVQERWAGGRQQERVGLNSDCEACIDARRQTAATGVVDDLRQMSPCAAGARYATRATTRRRLRLALYPAVYHTFTIGEKLYRVAMDG